MYQTKMGSTLVASIMRADWAEQAQLFIEGTEKLDPGVLSEEELQHYNDAVCCLNKMLGNTSPEHGVTKVRYAGGKVVQETTDCKCGVATHCDIHQSHGT